MRLFTLNTAVLVLLSSFAGASFASDLATQDTFYQAWLEEIKEHNPKRFLMGNDSTAALKKLRYISNRKMQRGIADVSAHGFSGVERLRVRDSDAYWTPHYEIKFDQPVSKGEIIYISAWFRSTVGGLYGKVKPHLYWDRPGKKVGLVDAWQKDFPDKWQRLHFSTIAKDDYAAGSLRLRFNFGYRENENIEMGGLFAVAMDSSTEILDLPKDQLNLDYKGREADAQWRKDALARIEKIRKGDLAIHVVDGSGKPVADAKVDVRLKQHEFIFGSEIEIGLVPGTNVRPIGGFESLAKVSPADKVRYQKTFQEFFNAAAGAMPYWFAWDPISAKRLEDYDAALKWLKGKDINVINSQPIYARPGKFPRKYRSLANAKNKAELYEAMKAQNVTWSKKYGKDMSIIQVANEWSIAYHLIELYGDKLAVDWIKQMRGLNPHAKISTNDCHSSDEYYAFIKYLSDNGAKPDNVAIQWHSGVTGPPPTFYLEKADKFSKLGVEIQVSEFDVKVQDPRDPKQQAFQYQYLQDCFIAFFSHESIMGVTYWGLWEPIMWAHTRKYGAHLINEDWSLSPAGKAYKDLVLTKWQTRESGKTNGKGSYSIRGFYGTYDVTVTANGKTSTQSLTLAKGGKPVTIAVQ